ncbi:MAG: hypothetical protein ACI83H_000455 [Glaciecola sp.]|jgi:hypothetical protein
MNITKTVETFLGITIIRNHEAESKRNLTCTLILILVGIIVYVVFVEGLLIF